MADHNIYQSGRDVGRKVSHDLTEARTVLSRAETALRKISAPYATADPNRLEIRQDLQHVVRLLEKWRRTGRKIKND